MKLVTIYGFACAKKDEKSVMQAVNELLATHNRTTSKAKSAGLLAAYEPRILKHFYWNLNKEFGTWFDIYPNEDAQGQFFFPSHEELGWLMHVRIDIDNVPSRTIEKATEFIQSILTAIPYAHRTIRESDDLVNGLPRGDFAASPL